MLDREANRKNTKVDQSLYIKIFLDFFLATYSQCRFGCVYEHQDATCRFYVQCGGVLPVAPAVCIGMPLVTERHGSRRNCRYNFGSFLSTYVTRGCSNEE
jgi:hypothetical protein